MQARGRHHRGIRPRVRGDVGDVHVVCVASMLLIELESRIERADQRFQRGKPGEQACLDRRHKDLLVLYRLEEELLLFVGALRQKLPHAPESVHAEAEVRMVVNHLHRFIQSAALRLRHLGLVIRVTHVEVRVGNEEEVPLLGGVERHGEAPRVAPKFEGHVTLRAGGEFGNGKLGHLLAKVPAGIELGGVFRLPSVRPPARPAKGELWRT